VYDLGHRVHHDIHVDELREVEVGLHLVKTEQLVGDVLQNTRLLAVEEVGHGHGGVEQLGLEQAEEPGLLLGFLPLLLLLLPATPDKECWLPMLDPIPDVFEEDLFSPSSSGALT
jgi:hypothetical protein